MRDFTSLRVGMPVSRALLSWLGLSLKQDGQVSVDAGKERNLDGVSEERAGAPVCARHLGRPTPEHPLRARAFLVPPSTVDVVLALAGATPLGRTTIGKQARVS